MKRCSNCILPETFPKISFNEKGTCNLCSNFNGFVPRPEKTLNNLIVKAKNKKRIYDVLVPLSGGKDSTYVLYLAKKIYGLNVLAYTYDNGFLTNVALENIKSAVETLNITHIFIKPNWDLQKKLYRTILLKTGELCTVCGIGIVHNYLKLSENWKIPLIMIGNSVMEENSSPPE